MAHEVKHWNSECRHEQEQDWILCEILHTLDLILSKLSEPALTGFTVVQTGGYMTPIHGAGSHFPTSEPAAFTPAVEAKETPLSTTPVTPTLALPDAGNTLVFTAVPQPAGATVPAGETPVWSTSDETNAPVTADSTGLVGSVTLGQGVTVGESITVTISLTLADGSVVSGSATFTVGQATPPPPTITGFTVTQTA